LVGFFFSLIVHRLVVFGFTGNAGPTLVEIFRVKMAMSGVGGRTTDGI
jgi:hypothetical protein